MSAVTVIGAQWGDEGKGKVVDALAGAADLVVRFQGGNNAGHTLVVDGHKTVVHLVPSGVLQPNAVNVIGPGVVVDPRVLLQELAQLSEQGVLTRTEQLVISDRAAVITPLHVAIDKLREQRLGASKIGTTGRGIVPAYEDVASRRAVRIGDLVDRERLTWRLERLLDERNALISWLGGETFELNGLVEELLGYGEQLASYIGSTGPLVRGALAANKRVLFEGAQGVLLDVLHGTHPFVTSSHTVAGAVSLGVGVAPDQVGHVVGVAKAYTTRVGAGPFGTELTGPIGERIREAGGEFGATTGRPRRCGWLDLEALRYTHALCGYGSIALTKLDVLTGFDEIKVCVAYESQDDVATEFPLDERALAAATPVYKTFKGWSEDIRGIRKREDLPDAARVYVDFIEAELGVPIALIGVGPGREESIGSLEHL